MKLNTILKLQLVAFLCFTMGCTESSSETTETTTDSTSVSIETSTTENVQEVTSEESEILQKILSRNKITKNIPLTTDSTYFTESSDLELNKKEVSTLVSKHFEQKAALYMTNCLGAYYTIDSLKANNTYEKYLEGLDVGMTRDAKAYLGPQIKISDNQFIQCWSITYGTTEACPYYLGSYLFGTLCEGNKIISSVVLGVSSDASDAPIWETVKVNSKIEVGSITQNIKQSQGGEEDPETGEESEFTTKNTNKLSYDSNGFTLVSSK